ncbi:MAG: PA14 domain-containing protein, partial [bacterium]|nr:PA14 domain-containing protein [bacterium]
RVWYDLAGNCLGDGPNEPDITFDKNWNCSGCSGILAYSKNDQIQFFSSRSIYFSAGKYRFALGSDDGSILYLDGSPIINSWSNHGYPSSPPTADIDLTAGYHNLQINYYENDGGARVSFSYYQILPTKVDCAFSNCIFDKTDLQCYGDRVAVGGYLRKTDGTAVAGKPLSLWMKKADGTYEKVVDLGNTDSTGYASKYWRPENTIYWDSKEYIVFWGGDADSQTSQTANYNLTVPHETCGQTDCSSEMIRRGYPSGDCRPNASGACSSYTNKDIVGEVGKCSQSTFFSDVAIWCSGCYSCPNTMPSNVFSIPGSSCTVTITGQGWDADGTIGGYHKFNADGNWREGIMDDNGCGSDNLKIKNTWSVSGNQFNITTNADRLGNTTNNLTAGFNLSSNCKISEVGKVATGGGGSDPNNSPVSCSTAATYKAKTNAGYTTYVFAAKYCGDGVQSCGEVCDPTAPGQSNCKPDCSGMNDATPPVINIGLASPPYSGWLTEGYYFVSITDTDPETGVNINECKYKIEEWNAGGITKVGDKKSLTARTCSEMVGINVGPDSWKLNAQGVNVYKIIATAKNNVGQEGSSELWLKIDYSKPTVR